MTDETLEGGFRGLVSTLATANVRLGARCAGRDARGARSGICCAYFTDDLTDFGFG